MKTKLFLIALISAAWAFPKGAEGPKFKRMYVDPLEPILEKVIPRIINGHEVVPHSIPYQAYLIITDEDGRWLCGGSLISPNYVLTAGHCVDGAYSAEVYLGVHNLRAQEDTVVLVNSEHLWAHEDYDEYYISNDIGVIELPTPVELNENINVISIPRITSSINYEGNNVRVSGWGLTKGEGGSTSPVLLEVNSTVISNRDCNRYYGIVENYQICISGSGGVGSCNGDSGGPLVSGNDLIGIVSYGATGCLSGYPSAFTRTTSFRDWIEANTDVKF